MWGCGLGRWRAGVRDRPGRRPSSPRAVRPAGCGRARDGRILCGTRHGRWTAGSAPRGRRLAAGSAVRRPPRRSRGSPPRPATAPPTPPVRRSAGVGAAAAAGPRVPAAGTVPGGRTRDRAPRRPGRRSGAACRIGGRPAGTARSTAGTRTTRCTGLRAPEQPRHEPTHRPRPGPGTRTSGPTAGRDRPAATRGCSGTATRHRARRDPDPRSPAARAGGPRGAREDAGPPRPRPLGTGREPARGRRDAGRGRRRPSREPVDRRRGAAGGEAGLLQVGAVRALSGPLLGLRCLEGPEPVRRPSGRQRARQARRGRRRAEDRQRGRTGRTDERLDAREGVAHALEAARLPGDGVPQPAHAGHERAHVLRGGVGVPAAPGGPQLAVRPLEPLRRGPQLLTAGGVALARGVEGGGVGAVVDPAVDELVAQRRGVAPTPRDAGDRHGPPPPAAVSSRRPDPGA